MPIMKTGRGGTLTVPINTDGPMRYKGATAGSIGFGGDCSGGSPDLTCYGTIQISAPWAAGVIISPVDVSIAGTGRSYGMNIEVSTPYGIASGNHYTTFTGAHSADDYTNSYLGSGTLSLDVDECIEFNFGAWDGYSAPEITEKRVVLVAHVGGSASSSYSCGGASASRTDTITTPFEVASWYTGGQIDIHTGNYSGTISASFGIKLNTLTCTMYLGGGYSKSDATSSIAADANSCSATASSGSGTWCNPASATASVACSPGAVRTFTVDGIARAWDATYPTTLGLFVDKRSDLLLQSVNAVAGAFSVTQAQRQHNGAGGSLNGVTQTPLAAMSEWWPARVQARPGALGDGDSYSLLALGEDVTDTRVLFRGFAYLSHSLYQHDSVTVDNGSTLTPASEPFAGAWTGDGVTTVSLASGVHAAVAGGGGSGSLTRTFTPRWGGFAGYGFLKITLSGDTAGRAFGVQITGSGGTQTWTRDYTGAALATGAGSVIIDLCSPGNTTAPNDPTDTRWPLPSVDGVYTGVSSCYAVELTDLVPGATYTITKVELVHSPIGATAHSAITLMPSFGVWDLQQEADITDDTSTTTYIQRMLDADTDGKRSAEQGHVIKTVTSSTFGGTTTTYSQMTLTDMMGPTALPGVGNATLEPDPVASGWESVPNPSLAVSDPADYGSIDDWRNNLRPATWAWGGGALYSGEAWTIGNNHAAGNSSGTALSIYAQDLADTVKWHPFAGDADNHSDHAFGGSYLLRAAYVIRGDGWGLVLDDAGLRNASQSVTATDLSDSSSAGSDTTTALGEYQTGSNYGRTGSGHTIRVAVGTVHYDRGWSNRRRLRVSFRAHSGRGNPFNWESEWAQFWRTCIRAADHAVLISQSDTPAPTPFTVVETVVDSSGTNRDPRVATDTRGRAHVTWSQGGDTYESFSDDEGRTWSAKALAITGGTHPTVSVGLDGSIVRAAYVSGNIKGTWQGPGDASPGAVTTFKDGSGTALAVEDDTFHLVQAREGAARWILTCVISGEGAPSEWACGDDSGFTFKRL